MLEKTLVILDEVQEVQSALTALKYFCEDAPEYHVAVAGSLLGLKVHSDTGFPVGKTDTLTLYPLSFMEFLNAMEKHILLERIKSRSWKELNAFSSQLTELLRQYYFTGGMPEVVLTYIETQDLQKVRQKQKDSLLVMSMTFQNTCRKGMFRKSTLYGDLFHRNLQRRTRNSSMVH